jgi:hypothetical protein
MVENAGNIMEMEYKQVLVQYANIEAEHNMDPLLHNRIKML